MSLERALLTEHIIIGHSQLEVYEKAIELQGWQTATGAATHLENIISLWRGPDTPWSVLNGVKVLDLASGSGYSHGIFGDMWYPQFSRLCALNGADVVAIDANPQRGHDKTLFAWVKADLVDVVLKQGLQSLPILKGKRFDLINSENFIGVNPYPSVRYKLAHYLMNMEEFERSFTNQAGELLAEGGIMSLNTKDKHYNRLIYTRSKDGIIPLDENF